MCVGSAEVKFMDSRLLHQMEVDSRLVGLTTSLDIVMEKTKIAAASS
jgi:hypothetical protein